MDLAQIASTLTPFLLFVIVALVAFGFAVWFGLRVVAPWLARTVDRAETEDETAP
jgi:Kef-type K+ transport system membrane component KefB